MFLLDIDCPRKHKSFAVLEKNTIYSTSTNSALKVWTTDVGSTVDLLTN